MEERKHKQAIATEGSQRRKYFHFRYRILFMAFLLISPSQAKSSGSEHEWFGRLMKCSAKAISLKRTHQDWLSLLQDEKLMTLLPACIEEIYQLIREFDWKEVHDKLPNTVKAFLQMIPNLIAKIQDVKGFALEAGLALVAGYFAWQSTELCVHAKSLELDLEDHKGQLELLTDELNHTINFIEKEVKPLWKNQDVPVNLIKTIESSIEELNDFANRLKELNDLVYKKNHHSSEKSVKAVGYMVGSGVVCTCSLCSRSLPLIVFVCGIGVYTAVTSYKTYNSLAKTLEESKQLRKNIQKNRKELVNFRASLKALKRKNDLKLLSKTEVINETVYDFANRLKELNDLVYKKNHHSSEESVKAVVYMVGSGVVCTCSLYSRSLPLIAFVCGFGGYTAVTSYKTYNSLAKTLQESRQLRKDTKEA